MLDHFRVSFKKNIKGNVFKLHYLNMNPQRSITEMSLVLF